MKYKFAKLNFWEELTKVTGQPVNITDDGDEITFDFGVITLTPAEEIALKTLMETKPMLRDKLAKFVKKE